MASYNMVLLSQIAAATAAVGFYEIKVNEQQDAQQLVADHYIEVNPQVLPSGNYAARTTELGSKTALANSAVKPSAAAPAGAVPHPTPKPSSFVIETGVPMPPTTERKSRIGAATYPFATMEIGASFHVPATPDKPDMAKSFASTVSSASDRLYPKQFKALPRTAAEEPQHGPGVRIWRVVDATGPKPAKVPRGPRKGHAAAAGGAGQATAGQAAATPAVPAWSPPTAPAAAPFEAAGAVPAWGAPAGGVPYQFPSADDEE